MTDTQKCLSTKWDSSRTQLFSCVDISFCVPNATGTNGGRQRREKSAHVLHNYFIDNINGFRWQNATIKCVFLVESHCECKNCDIRYLLNLLRFHRISNQLLASLSCLLAYSLSRRQLCGILIRGKLSSLLIKQPTKHFEMREYCICSSSSSSLLFFCCCIKWAPFTLEHRVHKYWQLFCFSGRSNAAISCLFFLICNKQIAYFAYVSGFILIILANEIVWIRFVVTIFFLIQLFFF